MTDPRTPTPQPDDERLLGRLAAADPVDPATLPSPDGPAATALLEEIVSGPSAEPARPGAPIVTSVSRSGSGSQPASLARRVMSGGRGALVAVAAAVLLVVGAVTVLAPDNTPAALAEVQGAAATTADADSGRIQTTFSLDYADDEVADRASGRIEAVYSGGDLGLSVQIDDVPAELGSEADDLLPALDDIRLVDDVAYVQQDGQWLAVDTGGLLGDLVVQYVDPRTVLDTIQTLTETSEVGPAEVDGVTTTQYRSIIDLGDETLAQSGWLAFEGMDAEADGEVTVDLYVDEAGALHRFDLSGQIRPADGSAGSATFEVMTTFSDIGGDITVEAPEGAVTFDPLTDGFGHDEDEDEDE